MAFLKTRFLSAAELESELPDFIDLLRDAVDSGASLGFVAPLTHAEARDYWLSLGTDLSRGARLLLAAYAGRRVVGTGQLHFPPWTNARHRAEVQKIMVDHAVRGRGIGRLLMTALHEEARRRGCSLLVLSTRRGEPPEHFYKGLGYREAGVIPGHTRGPSGERFDTMTLYQEFAA